MADVAGPLSPLPPELAPLPAIEVITNTVLGLRLGYVVGVNEGCIVDGVTLRASGESF